MDNRRDVQKIDVIWQHNKDGSMVPIKIRVTDEDGERQSFQIRGYRDLTYYIDRDSSEKHARNEIWQFECRILVFSSEKTVSITYNAKENIWSLAG